MENKRRFRPLSRRADFLKLKTEGQSFHVNNWLIVNIQKTDEKFVRCGWTISRQVGSAVVRNRLRRWGREYLRTWSLDHELSFDMNLIFKRREKDFYKSVSHKEFDSVMEKLVARIHRSIK